MCVCFGGAGRWGGARRGGGGGGGDTHSQHTHKKTQTKKTNHKKNTHSSKDDALDKYSYLTSLQGRNERLFYRVLLEHFEELLPVISTPTVRLACQRYGLMFKSLPRGLFITLEDRGRVFRILKNWPERNVRVIVVTDGERVGSMGDLGVQAIGVPISKLSLHTACGGVEPATVMPVVIDVGTDNDELLRSPLYVGVRHARVRGDAYYQLLDEFLSAVRR